MDYAKAASIKIGEIEGQSAELKTAVDQLMADLARLNKERAEWQGNIDATRVKIRTAIEDHNDRENSFWHQVGSVFGVSSDDGIAEQLQTLDGIVQNSRDRLYEASLRASLTEGAALQKYEVMQKALAQTVQVQAQLGTLKKSINVLDDSKFGMAKLRSAFDAFVADMNTTLPHDDFRWQRRRARTELLRDTMFDYGELFVSGILTSCDPVAIKSDTKQVPW